jgi:hypothetical protein
MKTLVSDLWVTVTGKYQPGRWVECHLRLPERLTDKLHWDDRTGYTYRVITQPPTFYKDKAYRIEKVKRYLNGVMLTIKNNDGKLEDFFIRHGSKKKDWSLLKFYSQEIEDLKTMGYRNG